MTQRWLAAGLTCAAVLWAVAVLGTPSSRSWPPLAASVTYAAGSIVCHQQPARSFHVRGVRLPVCARCTALYLAGALGALAGWVGTARPVLRARRLIVLAALPIAATVAAEWAGIATFSNAVRALSAVPLGAAAGWAFVRMLRADEAAPRIGYHARV